MEDVVPLSGGEIIALDGKTQRRSHDRKRGVKALHMVSAWACRNGVVLGQEKTQEKSNKITAIPQLLEKLELAGNIESFHQAVRSHWSIENELHWRLDVTFREDASRIRRGNAPHDMGVIRHVAMNLLKREPSKISVRKKRIRAALNDDFRHNILMAY